MGLLVRVHRGGIYIFLYINFVKINTVLLLYVFLSDDDPLKLIGEQRMKETSGFFLFDNAGFPN